MRLTALAIAALLLGACGQRAAHNQVAANSSTPSPVTTNQPAVEPVYNAAARAAEPPLSEPQGPIDPKSAEGAGQVVQHYGALIERERWLKAERLWGDIDAARAFATSLKSRFGELHLEIGKPGDSEGAAGSIYITEPVVFYGKARTGKALRLPADVTLRRVNDVPGSTEAERLWHIERIDWKESP